jgi:uncharacterized protein
MALPSVHQSEVPEQGLSLTCAVQPDELALPGEEGRFRSDLTLVVEIHRAPRGLTTRGVLTGLAIRECVRCLAEYEEPLEVVFAAEYRAKPQPKGSRGTGSVEPRDTGDDRGEEVYPYDGERLEMAEMLREQVILSSPMHPLCREDCLGLCPLCGENRNQRLCGCPEPGDAKPFTALRELQYRTGRMSVRPKGLPAGEPRPADTE